MPAEAFFIKKGLKRVELETYLEEELGKTGYGGAEIKRSPTGTRVVLHVERPGMVIGRKGKSIKQLTETLEKEFELENPQIEVLEIPRPELHGQIMAKRIAFALEKGIGVRRLGEMMLRRIMEAGARGVEIVISGRIAGERARSQRFYAGYLSKAGEPAKKLVSHGYAPAQLKAGIAGVRVSIMPPDVHMPDEIIIVKKEVQAQPEQSAAKTEAGTSEGEAQPQPQASTSEGEAQPQPEPTQKEETNMGEENIGDTEGE
ncbi:MAG: 30S ribosomal protein S3 [Candidatus Hadarchaeota archaeon]